MRHFKGGFEFDSGKTLISQDAADHVAARSGVDVGRTALCMQIFRPLKNGHQHYASAKYVKPVRKNEKKTDSAPPSTQLAHCQSKYCFLASEFYGGARERAVTREIIMLGRL